VSMESAGCRPKVVQQRPRRANGIHQTLAIPHTVARRMVGRMLAAAERK